MGDQHCIITTSEYDILSGIKLPKCSSPTLEQVLGSEFVNFASFNIHNGGTA